MNRRSILKLGVKAGVGLAGGAFVLGRTSLTIIGAGLPMSSAIPTEPSLMGAFIYAGVEAYTDNGATDPRNPLVSPLYADLHGFPPTLLQVGTQEVLLSDATRMADRMRAAGVAVTLEVWPGMFHGWQGVTDRLPEARQAMQHVTMFLRQHLGA